MDEIYELAEISESNGRWLAGHITQLPQFCLIRHETLGEGQFIEEKSPGRLRCSFMDDNGTFEIILSAIEIEVFQYNLSREERHAKTDLIEKRYEHLKERASP